jgi:hypothetical protein
VRAQYRLAVALVVFVLSLGASAPAQEVPAPQCNGRWYSAYSCGDCVLSNGHGPCTLVTEHWCGNDGVKREAYWGMWGCSAQYTGTDTSLSSCVGPVGSDKDSCDPLGQSDDNADGCAGSDCSLGSDQCTCKASCGAPACPAVAATCNPAKGGGETCGSGVDGELQRAGGRFLRQFPAPPGR